MTHTLKVQLKHITDSRNFDNFSNPTKHFKTAIITIYKVLLPPRILDLPNLYQLQPESTHTSSKSQNKINHYINEIKTKKDRNPSISSTGV